MPDKPATLTIPNSPNASALIPQPEALDRDTRHRLTQYVRWLDDHGAPWYKPDLVAYRDYLLRAGGQGGRPLQKSSVAVHLSTIRARYKRLLAENRTRGTFYDMATEFLRRAGQPDTVANRKAFVDEIITRIRNAIDPDMARVKAVTRQDRPDEEGRRLTAQQANTLMAAPGTDTLRGLRDTAIIALMLCTGIREAELAALEVQDLRKRLGGRLALHVRKGKGCKERLVPYGSLEWVLPIIDLWLNEAGIADGPAFRGLYKNGKKVRPGALSVRAIQYILASYPIPIDGEIATVRAHDLRRTYARRLYDEGVALVAIKQNLGHQSLETTLGYIGTLDVDQRCPPEIYALNLSAPH